MRNYAFKLLLALVFFAVETTWAVPGASPTTFNVTNDDIIAIQNKLSVKEYSDLIAWSLPREDRIWWKNEIDSSLKGHDVPMPEVKIENSRFKVIPEKGMDPITLQVSPGILRLDGEPYVMAQATSYRQLYESMKRILSAHLAKKSVHHGTIFRWLVPSAQANNPLLQVAGIGVGVVGLGIVASGCVAMGLIGGLALLGLGGAGIGIFFGAAVLAVIGAAFGVAGLAMLAAGTLDIKYELDPKGFPFVRIVSTKTGKTVSVSVSDLLKGLGAKSAPESGKKLAESIKEGMPSLRTAAAKLSAEQGNRSSPTDEKGTR